MTTQNTAKQVIGVPNPGSPLVSTDLTIAYSWFRLLTNLWLKVGGGNITNAQSVFLSASPTNTTLNVYDLDGNLLGTLTVTPP